MNIDRLRLISSIRPGQTLSTSTMTIVSHRSWKTSYSRRWAGDNRIKTRETISEIVTTGLEDIRDIPDVYVELLEDVALSLQFLAQTYEGDSDTVLIFRQLREKVLLFLKGYIIHRGRQYIADLPYTIFQIESMNLPIDPISIEKKEPALVAVASNDIPPLIRFDSLDRLDDRHLINRNELDNRHELKYHVMALLPERLFQMSPPGSLDSSLSSSPPSPPELGP